MKDYFIKTDLRKNWGLCCSYIPHIKYISHHIKCMCQALDKRNTNFENIISVEILMLNPKKQNFISAKKWLTSQNVSYEAQI